MSTKYNRSLHLSFSPGASNDDRIAESDSVLEDVETITTEKLDGSNSGIERGGPYGRSHAVYTQNPWDKNLYDIWRRIGSSLDENMFIFGENMYAVHSIEYTQLEHYFYVFGVRVGKEWISWDDVCETAYLLDLPTVPVLARGTFSDIKSTVLNLVKGESKLGGVDLVTRIPQMEGSVTRITSSFHDDDFSKSLLKFVRAGHVTTDEHWQRDWYRGMGKVAKLVNNPYGYPY